MSRRRLRPPPANTQRTEAKRALQPRRPHAAVQRRSNCLHRPPAALDPPAQLTRLIGIPNRRFGGRAGGGLWAFDSGLNTAVSNVRQIMRRASVPRAAAATAISLAAAILLVVVLGSGAAASATGGTAAGAGGPRMLKDGGPRRCCFLRPTSLAAAGTAASGAAGDRRAARRGPSPRMVVQVQYEEVDKRNFHGVLDRIREIGARATFWSLDTEFTGACARVGLGSDEPPSIINRSTRPSKVIPANLLSHDPPQKTAGYKQSERDEFFDTLQQRYAKKKEVAEKYLVVQMGLSAFVWDPALNDFAAFTWNIHIFPSAMVERIVACDASSLSFLREHGLDFNAWVDGVPFLALEQEASLRKQIEDQVRMWVGLVGFESIISTKSTQQYTDPPGGLRLARVRDGEAPHAEPAGARGRRRDDRAVQSTGAGARHAGPHGRALRDARGGALVPSEGACCASGSAWVGVVVWSTSGRTSDPTTHMLSSHRWWSRRYCGTRGA